MTLDWFVDVAQIIFADIILSGDNALVIGMAAAGLSANLRKRAIFIGMAVAAGLRIVFAVVASYLLAIKGILIIGGLLLAWVCWRFYNDLREFNAGDNTQLLVFGLALAIAFMAFFASMIMNVMLQFRWLSYLGLVFLIYLTAMMLYDGIMEFGVV